MKVTLQREQDGDCHGDCDLLWVGCDCGCRAYMPTEGSYYSYKPKEDAPCPVKAGEKKTFELVEVPDDEVSDEEDEQTERWLEQEQEEREEGEV